MVILNTLLAGLATAALSVTIAFVLASLRHKRYDLIDVFWGPTIALVAATSLIAHRRPWPWLAITATGLVIIWAGRLAWYIGRRWWRAPSEDPRYQTLRANWPQRAQAAQVYSRIYLVQALLASLVCLPVVVIIWSTPPIGWWTWAGLALWLGGFGVEVIADHQLAAFAKHPENRGRLLTTGLRRWIRHPNYLGEITLWWGLALVAGVSSNWWLAALGAGTITYLITQVSGVPPAEARLSHKPGWLTYRRQTGSLFPKLKS